MNCNVNRQHVLSLFDTLHDKYQFQDGEYKDFVETLAGKNVDEDEDDSDSDSDSYSDSDEDVEDFYECETNIQNFAEKCFYQSFHDDLQHMFFETTEWVHPPTNGQSQSDYTRKRIDNGIVVGDWSSWCFGHFNDLYFAEFFNHFTTEKVGSSAFYVWKSNKQRIRLSSACYFKECATLFHDQVVQEWKECTGRFTPTALLQRCY
jgi:hypothetical protein